MRKISVLFFLFLLLFLSCSGNTEKIIDKFITENDSTDKRIKNYSDLQTLLVYPTQELLSNYKKDWIIEEPKNQTTTYLTIEYLELMLKNESVSQRITRKATTNYVTGEKNYQMNFIFDDSQLSETIKNDLLKEGFQLVNKDKKIKIYKNKGMVVMITKNENHNMIVVYGSFI